MSGIFAPTHLVVFQVLFHGATAEGVAFSSGRVVYKTVIPYVAPELYARSITRFAANLTGRAREIALKRASESLMQPTAGPSAAPQPGTVASESPLAGILPRFAPPSAAGMTSTPAAALGRPVGPEVPSALASYLPAQGAAQVQQQRFIILAAPTGAAAKPVQPPVSQAHAASGALQYAPVPAGTPR